MGRALALLALAVALTAINGCRCSTNEASPAVRAQEAAASVRSGPPARPNSRSALGYNMDFPGDWTNLAPFIDLTKNGRAWAGQCSASEPKCDPVAHLDLDARGWVKSLGYKDDPDKAYLVVEYVIQSNTNHPDAGKTFVVRWKGAGTIDVFGGRDVRVAPEGGRLTFALQGENTYVRVTSTDPEETGDYVRDIQVYREDLEPLVDAGKLFHPELLAYLEPFGTLRFMDWMLSNEAGHCSGGLRRGEACYAELEPGCPGGRCVNAGKWSERPTVDQPSLLSSGQFIDNAAPSRGTKVGGYPVDVLVALANEAVADPHFNMPALYEDEYVEQFAKYVRDHLSPNLRARVEYSNEVWNWGFSQASYAHQAGRALWPDEGTAWIQFMASRTQNMCKIWRSVFADAPHRMQCLISPQTAWRDNARKVLDCPAWTKLHPELGKCSRYADGIAISGYFSGCLPDHEEEIKAWLSEGREVALDKAFEQLEHGKHIKGCEDSLDHTIDAYRYYEKLAKEYQLELYVYEGGSHFDYSGADPAVKQLLVEMTRDERMYAAYLRNYRAFKAAGGTVFNVWGWIDKDSLWANAESVHDRTHAKYRAIVDFVRQHPCWWEGCDRDQR